MAIQFQSTVLISDNFTDMVNFYKTILNQDIQFDFGNCITFKSGLTIWQLKEDYPIAKHLGRTFDKNGNKNLELCFETDDFTQAIAKLKEAKPRLLHDVAEERWGQQTIRFFDPDDNLVELGETIPCFIKRFHDQGMTAEQVAERTSVSLDYVKEIINS